MVKDAALRQAEAQRVWIDGALIQRKHKDAMALLGAIVYERILSGDLRELEDDPEIGDAVRLLEELEVRLEEAAERTRERASRAGATAARAASSFAARAGLDSRAPRQEDPGEVRVWRPVRPSAADLDPYDDDPVVAAADDGTVSALGGSAPARPRPGRTRPRRAARGAGGIRFVDDAIEDEEEDLAEYMHPDDVPEDPPKSGDDGHDDGHDET